MYELSSPLLLVVEVTSKCNLQCAYCYNKLGDSKIADINSEVMARLLKEAREIGVFDINFCGGEPFCHKDFITHIKTAKSFGFDLTINTNGTLITKEIAHELKQLDVIQHIQVSFDGHTREINDRTRGKFDLSFRGFRLLCEESGKKSLSPSVGIVVTLENYLQLQEIIEFYSDFTDRIHLMNVMGHPELRLTDESRARLNDLILPKIKSFAEKNKIQITRINKNSKCDDFTYKGSHIDCLAGHTFLAITPNLDILPCDICRNPIGKWLEKGDILKTHQKSMKIWRSLEHPWCLS